MRPAELGCAPKFKLPMVPETGAVSMLLSLIIKLAPSFVLLRTPLELLCPVKIIASVFVMGKFVIRTVPLTSRVAVGLFVPIPTCACAPNKAPKIRTDVNLIFFISSRV